MKPVPFKKLLNWILGEYDTNGTIFGIPAKKFYHHKTGNKAFSDVELFGTKIDTPFGPAAGPHTQLAQNIISSYLTGARFIELKTVQIMDELEIEKPCIDAYDECYNTEWSQELKLEQSIDEYIKSWIILHFLKKHLNLSDCEGSGFIFNMSVGYDLKGIKEPRMDLFINTLIDASEPIAKYMELVKNEFPQFGNIEIPSEIINSATVSTMHGCPPAEIESIAAYLLKEKKLHTYVKLNPTLLSKEKVMGIIKKKGFNDIDIKDETFEHDLCYSAAIDLINNLKKAAGEEDRNFGIKLSNTLANINMTDILPGDERYMSGRLLFPITITLADKISREFDGKISISYSGGAGVENITDLLDSGIYPVTLATDILKPGGYSRFFQIADKISHHESEVKLGRNNIHLEKLSEVAVEALENDIYSKEIAKKNTLKIDDELPVLDCILAPCVVTCPIHQNIPSYINLINEGKYDDAAEMILKKNPLPNITGYICDHECQSKCVRYDYDNPVMIRDLKRYAFSRANVKLVKKESAVNAKVAVVGGGPAGMAVAYYLAREGFNVTILESRAKLGGTVRYVIPPFRLPDEVIDRDVKLLEDMGVVIKTNQPRDFSVDELKKSGFNYVYLGIGAEEGRELGLTGNDADGYYNAVKFLEMLKADKNSIKSVDSAIIIGGGNSAMDAARSANILGAKKVYIVYRRTLDLMPADKEEIDACIAEGVKFIPLLSPMEIVTENGKAIGLKCQKMKLGEIDSSGRARPEPIEGAVEVIDADLVISAVGEQVEKKILESNGIKLNRNGTIIVDEDTCLTTTENVFAGGDNVRGPASVVLAAADGKKVALAIMNKEKLDRPKTLIDNYYQVDEAKRVKYAERSGEKVYSNGHKTLSEAEKAFDKTCILTLSDEQAQKESSRCLGCNVSCGKCVEVCPNRANMNVMIKPLEFTINQYTSTTDVKSFKGRIEQDSQVVHVDSFCNECGNCETFCPHGGKPYKKKFTYFDNLNDFKDSENPGFMKTGDQEYVLRGEHFEFELKIDNNSMICKSTDFSFTYDLNSFDILKAEISKLPCENFSTSEFPGYFHLIMSIEKKHSYIMQ